MSLRRLPIIATIVVLIAVGIMIRLGFWQLDRLHQKEALLARYAQSQTMSADVRWPRTAAEAQAALYRHATLNCEAVSNFGTIAGQNAAGKSGLAHTADCGLPEGGKARIVLGWSSAPDLPHWSGGRITGIVAPGPRLVANPPVAGLGPNLVPDPSAIPNNHFAYAVQWFLFAGVALVIYALAVRKRLAANAPRG
jgi:surfeit locus 1 family protein